VLFDDAYRSKMASRTLSSKSFSSDNILISVRGLSLTGLTAGLAHPLSLLSEHRKHDKDDPMYHIDKVKKYNIVLKRLID
jgi:hypothetical protein